MKPIAHIHTDFPEKFGLPRQSGLIDALTGRIVMEPDYRRAEAFRGLEGFSHIWLLWEFSAARRETWSPTVRPPRLGGNRRMGVFATRSPFRPNSIGLSCVRLEKIEFSVPDGPVLLVAGIDLMDGTPIYDIKPYIPLTDCRPEASEGYTAETKQHRLAIVFPESLKNQLPEDKQVALTALLEQDPRPAYEDDPERIYGVSFCRWDVRFTVATGVLTVVELAALERNQSKERT